MQEMIAKVWNIPQTNIALRGYLFAVTDASLRFGVKGLLVGGNGVVFETDKTSIGERHLRVCTYQPGGAAVLKTDSLIKGDRTLYVPVTFEGSEAIFALQVAEIEQSYWTANHEEIQRGFRDHAETYIIEPRYEIAQTDAVPVCQ